jgi:hypothetical protein
MQTGCLFYSKQKKIMENEIKETLERVADTVLNEPVEITVDVISPRRVWWKFWIEPVRKRVFKIQQITYGNLIRISKLLLSVEVDENFLTSAKLMDQTFTILSKHGDTITRIVATALHNKKSEPPTELIDFVKHNFSSKELFEVFSIILRQMDITSFISTIITMKGLSVLEEGKRNVMSQ